MNRKKEGKKGLDIYSDLSYHLFFFEWRLNHILGKGRFKCMVSWGVITRVSIVYLVV